MKKREEARVGGADRELLGRQIRHRHCSFESSWVAEGAGLLWVSVERDRVDHKLERGRFRKNFLDPFGNRSPSG